jgi:beta-ureidopropionase
VKARCALIQMSFVASKQRNVERGAELIGEAARAGAQIICLPELATTIYFCTEMNPTHRELAEPVPGPSTQVICEAAREAGAYVVFPLFERGDDGNLYNTAVFIGPDGEIQGSYRKNSIPLVNMPEIVGIEKYYFRPGNLGYPVFPTEFGVNVGITICYERHFPEGARSLALNGADVIFFPTATVAGRGIWDLEIRAHAVANLLWCGGVNRVGRDDGGSDTEFYGSSFFSNPAGVVVASAGDQGEEIVHAEIDTELSAHLREEWGFFRDRRPEIYQALTTP